MRKNKRSIDWEANEVHLGSKDSQITLPLVTSKENFQEKLPSSNQQPPQAPATQRKLFVRGTNDQEASTSQAPTFVNNIKPNKPKHESKTKPPTTATLKSKRKPTPTSPKSNQRWVPKSLLVAQGYYVGVTTLWIPRNTQPTQGKGRSTGGPTPTRPKVEPLPCRSSKLECCKPKPSRPPKHNIGRPKLQQLILPKQVVVTKWVPLNKKTYPTVLAPVMSCQANLCLEKAPLPTTKTLTSKKNMIQEHAKLLQVKLFGSSSCKVSCPSS